MIWWKISNSRCASFKISICEEETVVEINNHIKDGKLWKYNFEYECKELQELNNTLIRYFSYKATGLYLLPSDKKPPYPEAEKFIVERKEKYKVADCDNCDAVSQIYSALWSGSSWRGDTMNSVQYNLNYLYRLVEKKVNSEIKLTKRGRNQVSIRYMLQCLNDEPAFCDIFLSRTGMKDIIEQHINAYHTLGNFVLVPAGFNKYRATQFNDYWDKSLECLRVTQLGEKGFEWYINYFFLWDYVTNKNGGYEIEYVGTEDKGDKRNFSKFFTTTTDFIYRRGKFMTAMLDIQAQKPGLYKDILDFLISGECFGSIFDAANNILKNFDEQIPEAAKNYLSELKQEKV